ncbi:MAG: efflux RND transporter permease subunit [Pseudomonadota bacterium]
MIDLLYRRPVYLWLVLLTIVSLGALSFSTIGRQEDPTITNLFATVITPYPGADPARVEALVTEKIEAELREIPEIETISSNSRTGLSAITIELSSFISSNRIEQVWSEVRDALGDAARELPPGVPDPAFDNDRTGAFTMIAGLRGAPGVEVPRAILGRLATDLQERLRQVPLTKEVRVYGAPEEEILVEIDADRAAAMGLTTAAVAAAVAQADAKVSAGQVRGTGADLVIEVAGEVDGLQRVRDIVLRTGPDGQTARLGDIATVARAIRQPMEDIALIDGEPAVLIAARIEDDRQVDVWANATRDAIATTVETLPDGIDLEIVFDQSRYTAERLGEVGLNLALGVVIVLVVLLLTMGWRSAVVVGAMLPLTSLMTLAILERLGVVIHQMSVTGLIVALGLLVDAAIVMTDEIGQRLSRGFTRSAAIQGAVRRLAGPLVASTLTTLLAFTPMAALPGPAGDFVGAIALSVIVMLVASLALALTVGPAIAGRLLPASDISMAPRQTLVARLFTASLNLALRWRWLALAAAAAPAIIGFAAFPTLTAQFFPEVDRDQFHVQVELGEGAAIGETERLAGDVDVILRADPDVIAVTWAVGRSAPAFYYNMLDNRDADPTFAEALVTTRAASATNRAIPRLQDRLDREMPAARILVRGLKQGPPVDAPLEVRLVGPELETLRALGEDVRAMMADLPMVTHSRADLSGGAPKIVFALDEEAVRIAGLSLVEVARQIDSLSEGAVGGSLVEGPEELPIRVRLDAATRADPSRLMAQRVIAQGTAPAGSTLPGAPLSALGAMSLVPSDAAIARRDGERVNTVQGFLAHGVLPDEALSLFRTRLADRPLDLPAGYRIEFGGDSDARGETVRNLLSVVGLVVIGSVATIVLTFNSWRLSAVALVVCVLSAGLSVLTLAVFQYPFGIQALIGVIGGIGVSINAAIVVLTALQADPGAAAGSRGAVASTVARSGRHIISTTLTTFGGFLPLILAGGGFWPPFAMAIAGGVLLSSIVSLYFVPVAFSLVARRTPVPAEHPALDREPILQLGEQQRLVA